MAAAVAWLGQTDLGSKDVKTDVVANRLADIIFQNAASTKRPHPVLSVLDLRTLTFNSSIGNPFKAAFVHAAGFAWAADGANKPLWHAADIGGDRPPSTTTESSADAQMEPNI